MSENDKTNKTAHADGKENTDKNAAPIGKDKKDPKEEELVSFSIKINHPSLQSEEDLALKEKLDLLCERLSDMDLAQRKFALGEIKKEVSGAISSMTSVPKPLKFLTKQYPGLKEVYNTLYQGSDLKVSSN